MACELVECRQAITPWNKKIGITPPFVEVALHRCEPIIGPLSDAAGPEGVSVGRGRASLKPCRPGKEQQDLPVLSLWKAVFGPGIEAPALQPALRG